MPQTPDRAWWGTKCGDDRSSEPCGHLSQSLRLEKWTSSPTLNSRADSCPWVRHGRLRLACCGSRFPYTQIPTPQLLSWTPSWPFSVMLGLGTFPPVFVFTEFANLSLGLKPGKPSAFSIHSPPFPAGLQKDPGNAVGRTSDALRGRAPLPKLPAKPGELATTQHRPATAGLHHRGPS